jgi:hypothetical protein
MMRYMSFMYLIMYLMIRYMRYMMRYAGDDIVAATMAAEGMGQQLPA